MTIDVEEALIEYAVLKTDNANRNFEYYLNRQAIKGNFQWPRDWPNHIPKIKHNMCKPITERFSSYLMGNMFTYNVNRPNTLEFRDGAERTEKILRRLVKLAKGNVLFSEGADSGSVLGRTVYKVYKTGPKGRQHACFQHVQPDYFYGIPATDSPAGEWAKVFYSYPIDRAEAVRMFGEADYKTEFDIAQNERYTPMPEESQNMTSTLRLRRRIPVFEVWTNDSYLLRVGGIDIFNGDNPFKWTTTTNDGFIPFVVIENIHNDGEQTGASDLTQSRALNEQLNYLLSRKQYIVGRWLQPTLVWEGAPQNYLDILTSTIGGGGAIPTRLGSRLYFLAYDHTNASVTELEATLRTSILETAGLNEIAYQGTVHGYVNSGPSVNAQYQPVTALLKKKQETWRLGIALLFSMLLELQENIGDSEALGLTVVNSTVNSKNGSDGDVVQLSGKDIAGLREVDIVWPGLLPKDDAAAAQLEFQKAQQGLQSIYTTLEKLGEEYPDDEIARIRMENTDPALKGDKVAEQMRAQGAMDQSQANAEATRAGIGQDPNAPQQPPQPGQPAAPAAPPSPGGPQLDQSGPEPVIGNR